MPARGRYSGKKGKRKAHEPVWTHDSNTRQEITDLPTHNPVQAAVQQYYSSTTAVLQQYSRTLYNSETHEAIHPPTMTL